MYASGWTAVFFSYKLTIRDGVPLSPLSHYWHNMTRGISITTHIPFTRKVTM